MNQENHRILSISLFFCIATLQKRELNIGSCWNSQEWNFWTIRRLLFNIIQPPKQYRLPTASNIDPPRLRDVSLSIQMVVTAKSKPDIEAAKILLTSCRSNLISWGFRGDWIRDLQMNHWFLSQAWQARSEPSMMLSSRFREPDSSGWLAVSAW